MTRIFCILLLLSLPVLTNSSFNSYIFCCIFRSGLIVELDSFSFFSVDRDADEYFMGHTKRGKAYIFNHEHFDANPWLNQRTGTNKDRDDLCAILKDYDFDVTVFNDLTLKELNKESEKVERKLVRHIKSNKGNE